MYESFAINRPENGLSLDDLKLLEKLKFKGKGPKAKQHQIGFVVFDCRLRLIRLPSYPTESMKNWKYYLYVVYFSNHFFTFQNPKVGPKIMVQALSYYRAALQYVNRVEKCPTEKQRTNFFMKYKTKLEGL